MRALLYDSAAGALPLQPGTVVVAAAVLWLAACVARRIACATGLLPIQMKVRLPRSGHSCQQHTSRLRGAPQCGAVQQ